MRQAERAVQFYTAGLVSVDTETCCVLGRNKKTVGVCLEGLVNEERC